jgi:hypothetical protein
MRQEGDSVPSVIRPTWQGTDLQERLLAAAVESVKLARTREEEAWSEMQKAREAGVPDTVLCRRAEVSRATLNRKLGARPDGADDPGE